MFDEREALRLRFEKLNFVEITVRQEYQKEREKIFLRLRELDQIEKKKRSKESLIELAMRTASDLKEASKENLGKSLMKESVRGNIPSNVDILREATIKILNKNKTPISSSVLQKRVQNQTGMRITNMTVFMNNLMNKYPNVKKPNRGQYLIK
ncbi:hypothetical protein ABEP12_02015 [Bacillus velezensis]